MEKIGFVGAFDKIDLILCIAKILTECGEKILIADTTLLQKARYIVPYIAPTKSYVTSFENIDIAVGFDSMESLDGYMGNIENEYNYFFVDVDDFSKFDSFHVYNSKKIYFFTAFDSYSLKKGMEVIGTMRQQVKMEKVYFEREIAKQNDEYLNLLSREYPIRWEEEILHFPYDQGDLTALIENQKVEKIKVRNLSEEYRLGLVTMIQEIAPEIKSGDLRKVFKNI